MWDALFSGLDWIYTGPIAIGYFVSWLFLILGKRHMRLFGILERAFEALREWVCFSTGEWIRPASIFDA
jgi:hypothetical protein